MKFPQPILNGLKGFAMGASDIVPGVSGGTMALILGIYERLLRALKSFDMVAVQQLKRGNIRQLAKHIDFSFLLSVAAGMGLAIVGLSHPLAWLLETYPAYLWAFFLGLIIASVFLLKKRMRSVTYRAWALGAIGTGVGFWITGLVPGQTAQTPFLLFLSGCIAISAMMLPGISGSFLLVIFGKYEQVVGAVRAGDIATLLPFAIGALVGLFAFAKALSWLLKNYHDPVLALLIGLMIGSLRKIWPWQADLPAAHDVVVAGMILVGVLLVFGLHRLSKKKV